MGEVRVGGEPGVVVHPSGALQCLLPATRRSLSLKCRWGEFPPQGGPVGRMRLLAT